MAPQEQVIILRTMDMNFLKVVSVIDTDPYTVKFDIVGLTTNTGIT